MKVIAFDRSGRLEAPPGLMRWLQALLGLIDGAAPDLTNRQTALLMVICFEPGAHTVRGLAARLHLAKPVVSRALSRLGEVGYIRRLPDKSDRRSIFVVPTGDAIMFLERLASLWHSPLHAL